MQVYLEDYAWGAGVAGDLVNTSPAVMTSTGEALPDPAALCRFLAEHAVRPDALAGGRVPTADELARVHELRDTVRAVLEADTEEDVAAGAGALVTRAGAGPTLARGSDQRWQWHARSSPLASLADELAMLIGTGVLGVLRTLSHERFRRCASPTCSGLFVDTSRAGRRRYCMPDRCGNRLNVANHRARQRSADTRRNL